MEAKNNTNKQTIAKDTNNGHDVNLKIIKAPPEKINPGAYMQIKVQGYCSSFCSLKASAVQILDSNNNVLKEVKLILENGPAWESDAVILRAPSEPGNHKWVARFIEQQPPLVKEPLVHNQAEVSCEFMVLNQHLTSMAAWDIPSPVEVGSALLIKAGVRCSNSCSLAGKEIALINAPGEAIAKAALKETPLKGTDSMYWAELSFKAPDEPDGYVWRVTFKGDDAKEGAHLESRCTVAFTVVPKAECSVNVNVRDKQSGEALKGLKVSLPPYSQNTDDNGAANLMVAKGKYKLTVGGGNEYFSFSDIIFADKDTDINVELTKRPPVLDD